MPDTSFIVALDREQGLEPSLVGPKAYTLARLAGLGFRVPAGFCVTTEALARCRDRGGPGSLPDELGEAIDAAAAALEPPTTRWAVRSSALVEDRADASFAGQFLSVLDVASGPPLHAAILACRASYADPRVQRYRDAVGSVTPGPTTGGVIVQRMLDTELSGVMFTVDPIAEDPDQLVICVGQGHRPEHGAGTASLDTLRADRQGHVRERVSAGLRPLLTDALVAELVELGLAIEAALGGPQDIEWCIERGRVWVVQARPSRSSASGWRELQLADDIAESYPQAITPLTRSLFDHVSTRQLKLIERLFGVAPPAIVHEIDGRYYTDVDARARLFARLFPGVDPAIAERRDSPLELLDGPGRREFGVDPLRSWPLLVRGTGRLVASMLRVPLTASATLEAYVERVEEIQRERYATLTDERLGALLDEVLASIAAVYAVQLDCFIGAAWCRRQLMLRSPEAIALGPVDGLVELGFVDAVARLAELARTDAAFCEWLVAASPEAALAELDARAPQAFVGAFDHALREFGHLSSCIGDIGVPRFAEQPGAILKLVVLRLQAPQPAGARTRADRPTTPADPLTSALAAGLRYYTRHRQNAKFQLLKGLVVVREVALAHGQRLVERGVLDRREQVFLLRRSELVELLRGGHAHAATTSSLLTEREAILARHREATLPRRIRVNVDAPAWIPAGGPRFTPGTDALTLQGLGASPGIVSGRARRVTTPVELDELDRDSILIMTSVDPSWIPVFELARGLIVEFGTPLSHGAIIARELGLPTIVGVGEATRQIEDGQHLTIDGGQGWVRIHTNPPDTVSSLASRSEVCNRYHGRDPCLFSVE